MSKNHLGYDPSPFATNPNPNCLFLTPNLKSVKRKVHFTVDKRQGVTTILGDVGLGKSSIMKYIFNDYEGRDNVVSQYITTPRFPSDFALLKHLSFNFGVPIKRSMTDQLEDFNNFLIDRYSEGKNVVIFIDEAQKLDTKMLELVRTLLNFESNDAKLIQFVLAGQIELWTRLKSDQHKALYSRIFTNSLLDPLTFQETVGMIDYRSQFNEIKNPFSIEILESIYSNTGGVPRDILKICAFAYDLMLEEGAIQVSQKQVDESVQMAATAKTREIEAEKEARKTEKSRKRARAERPARVRAKAGV